MNKAAMKNCAIWIRTALLALFSSGGREVADLWFDRLIMLRFMDVNGYLDTPFDRQGVLTPQSPYAETVPFLFTPMETAPEGLEGILTRLCDEIPAEAFMRLETVGYFYQYSLTQERAAIVDTLHGKSYRKEDLPTVTQVFTPEWVVKYLVDNSLGRYWLEHHPESKLKEKLGYLAVPKEGFERVDRELKPEELTVLDPCVGAGHFLIYTFDLLMEIYTECGWKKEAAARSILENNLFGLDIDPRVCRIAHFAMRMKALEYGVTEGAPHPRVYAIPESNTLDKKAILALANGNKKVEDELEKLLTLMQDAKEYGSILKIEAVDLALLRACAGDCDEISSLVAAAWLMVKQYDVVVTNPPYMNKYSPALKAYIHRHYSPYRGDLFSVFIYRCLAYCKPWGYTGMMTPNVWMFIHKHEALRRHIIETRYIANLVQMAKGAFFKEATVDVCAFVIRNQKSQAKGQYIRLDSFRGDMALQEEKLLYALAHKNCGYYYEKDQASFAMIPASPIAYWISEALLSAFGGEKLGKIAEPKQGLATGCNALFLRRWYEVATDRICFDARNTREACQSGKKWFPYNKGGDYRKWYGNDEYLVDWEKDGLRIKAFRDSGGKRRSRPQNTAYYFKPCISWSLVSSGKVAFRYKPAGQIFDIAGMSCFSETQLYYLLALCNSSVALEALDVLAPTINFQAGDIACLPILQEESVRERVEALSKENIALAKADWDAFEISWDFKKHPLV